MPARAYFLNERDAPPVAQQSMVELDHWRLLLTPAGELRLALALSSQTLRITSPVVAVDLAAGIARTWSGRLYRFTCPPEQDDVVRVLIMANAVRSGFASATDVSDQAWSELSGTADTHEIFQAARITLDRVAPDPTVTHSEH